MQLAWKVDDCTVAILEWNQNNNIFDKPADGDRPEGNDFHNLFINFLRRKIFQ